ncbi:hypothetical protein ACWATR_39830 [Nostoc sp. UIC 10890]
MPYYTRELDAIISTATAMFEAVEMENRSIRLL